MIPSGYKQTKVGVVPEDWDVVKLKDIVKVSQGLQIPIRNRFVEPSNNRVFYITIPYTEGKKVEYIEDANESVLCEKNDLLIVRTGSGAGNIITGVEGAFHNNFFKIKGFDRINIKFLYFFLTSKKTKFIMRKYASNGTIPDLPHGDFYSISCNLPPLKEQQKIAQILTTWDDAISKQEKLIKAKERLKKGLMQKLLSGKVRFAGFDGEWEEVRFGDVATFHKGKGISKNDISHEGVECIRYGELYTKYNERIEELISKTSIAKKDLFLSEENDILIPASGETAIDLATASCVLKKDIGLGGDINVIRTYHDGVFLSYYLNIVAKIKIASLAQGVSVIHLYTSQLKSLKIKFPPKQEQQKIAKVLTTADKEIELLKKEFESLKEQKKGLMQRLLSGEVRVKV